MLMLECVWRLLRVFSVADVDVTDLGVVLAQTTLMPVQSISANRPSTVNQRRIKGQSRRLEPLQEPATLVGA